MIVKRRNWLTHIILIALVVIILFPVVWVISTSLRRDNAAFSTKLFSSRVSIQNYKDLLFPEQNVLRLMKDIEAITTNTMPYSEKSFEELVSKFDRDIKRLKDYSNETKMLIEKTDEEYQTIQGFIEDNSEELLNSLKENAGLIGEKLDVKKPDDSKLYLALNVLLKEGIVKEKDIDDFFDLQIVKDYEEEWKNNFETLALNIENKQQNIKVLEDEVNSLKKELEEYQKEYTRISSIIRSSILPQFESFEKSLNTVLDILNSNDGSVRAIVSESNEKLEFEKILGYLEELNKVKLTDEFSEFSEKISNLNKLANEVLNLWENYPEKYTSKYADFLSIIRLFILKASKQLKESVDLMNNFSNVVENYLELSNLINVATKKLEKEKLEYETLKVKYDEKVAELVDANRYVFSLILKDDILSFNEKISKYTLPKDINKTYFAVKALGRSLNDYLVYVDDENLKKELRAYLRKMDWAETYKNFKKRYERFSKDFKVFVEEFDNYVKNIEEIGPNAISSAKNGIKIRITALVQLFPKIQSDYPAKIASNLSLVSKYSADLIDQLPIKGAKESLKMMDKNLFRIDQIWKEKTEHHLIRWIMNSVIVAGLVAVITTLVNALAAYPFSRMRFKGRKYGIMSLLLIQMFPAIMYMVALYGFLSFIGRYIPILGLNTLGGLIFVYLGGIAFNMYLIKGFYDTIPSSLEEAAMIDGATRWQTFWRIVLPLASPILAVVIILSFMGTFNEFVLARIILQDVDKYTYAVGLWTFSTGPFETEWGLFSAAALIGMAPMVILFLSMQKYLVGGLTKGSVKG
ncbi:MAG: ABC transporter permease subunit [Thermosipho sp. (in: Bacteria)]|nr:ABC transporter permease subunit [Thermosipho sp. (in: thermotogales)]